MRITHRVMLLVFLEYRLVWFVRLTTTESLSSEPFEITQLELDWGEMSEMYTDNDWTIWLTQVSDG